MKCTNPKGTKVLKKEAYFSILSGRGSSINNKKEVLDVFEEDSLDYEDDDSTISIEDLEEEDDTSNQSNWDDDMDSESWEQEYNNGDEILERDPWDLN